jgi:hypothetical protein
LLLEEYARCIRKKIITEKLKKKKTQAKIKLQLIEEEVIVSLKLY